MSKRTRTKAQTKIYKTLHIKLKIEQQEPTKNWGFIQVFRKGKQFILTSDTLSFRIFENKS